jgi:type II secretion system protein H
MHMRRSSDRPTLHALRGFTLIEVLVVLLIIGIVVAMTGLTLGAGTRSEVRDFAVLVDRLASARDLAETSGRATAVRFDEDSAGVVWQRDQEGEWQRLPTTPELARDLKIVRIEQAGRVIPLARPIVFGPDGVGHGFSITVTSHGVVRTVVADAANTIRLLASPAESGP